MRKQKQAPGEIDNRQKCYLLLALGKKQLGWDDEFYYGIWLPQQGATKTEQGRYSATTMNISQLFAAVEAMKRSGFKVSYKSGNKKNTRALAGDEQSKKIRALWLDMHEQGIVKNPSEPSLAAYVKRLTQVDALQWLSTDQASRVIESLKKWRQRELKSHEAA